MLDAKGLSPGKFRGAREAARSRLLTVAEDLRLSRSIASDIEAADPKARMSGRSPHAAHLSREGMDFLVTLRTRAAELELSLLSSHRADYRMLQRIHSCVEAAFWKAVVPALKPFELNAAGHFPLEEPRLSGLGFPVP